MKRIDYKLNIETINVILIFVGFAMFTTFVNSGIGSIIYRGIALIIGVICILKNQIECIKHNNSLKLFIILFVILTLRMVYEMYFGEDAYTPYTDSRNFLMLFTFGICWIPFMGALYGFSKVKGQTLVIYLFWILLVVICIGIIHRGVNTSEFGRVALNARQSTLAFGDNGAYLAVLSACILSQSKTLPRYYKFISIAALIIGLYSAIIAGSRGPFVSSIVGLLFVFISLNSQKKVILIILSIGTISGGLIGSDIIEKISPAMATRMTSTIEDGDMSGRDKLFEDALDLIYNNPFGANPIILEPGGTFSGYHNVYLGTGVGTGPIGFILFILLITCLLYRSAVGNQKNSSLFNLAILALFWFYCCRGITGVGLLTNSMFDVLFAYTCIILHHSTIKHPKTYDAKKINSYYNR